MATNSTRNGKPTKTAAVLAYVGANPTAKASEVVEAMKKQGVKVNVHRVYMIKSYAKLRKRKAKRVARAEKSGVHSGNGHVIAAADAVMRVKALAESVGGMKRLKQLV